MHFAADQLAHGLGVLVEAPEAHGAGVRRGPQAPALRHVVEEAHLSQSNQRLISAAYLTIRLLKSEPSVNILSAT